jgi:hypothetical protein
MGKLLSFPQTADFGARFSERVLQRLFEARAKEPNPHLEDDLVVAWHSVCFASQGNPTPHVDASYKVFSCHPDFVFARITAWRKAKLGIEYRRWFDEAGNPRPSYPNVPDYDPTTGFLLPRPQVRQSPAPKRVSFAKAPLRLVVKRKEIREGERVLYHIEQLECGHSHMEFLDANPGKQRRRCRECMEGTPVVAQEPPTPDHAKTSETIRILFA